MNARNPALGLLLIVPVLLACGHHDPKPGTKETVTAYESDGTTVIKFEPCEKIGASFNYPQCGKLLRDEVSANMCNRGPGTHSWMYQIGATSPMPQTTHCK